MVIFLNACIYIDGRKKNKTTINILLKEITFIIDRNSKQAKKSCFINVTVTKFQNNMYGQFMKPLRFLWCEDNMGNKHMVTEKGRHYIESKQLAIGKRKGQFLVVGPTQKESPM